MHITFFEDDESEFEVRFRLLLYQVSKICDRNSHKMAKIPLSDFLTKNKIFFNLTFFVDKNNAYTPIRVCWIRFLYQFWHNSAHNASKLALKFWKSKNFTFSIFDEQSQWINILNCQIFFEQVFILSIEVALIHFSCIKLI